MADIVNQAKTQVTVDGQQAASELTALEKKARKFKDQMIAANNAGDTKAYNKAQKGLKEVDKEMRNVLRSSYDVNKVLNNLSTAGPKQLKAALSALNKELNSGKVARGSKEWNDLQQKIKLVRTEITKLNTEQNISQTGWQKFTGGFSKYFTMIGTFIVSITGLSFAFRKLAEDVAKMDDVYADVMKTTGMTREQVVDLNDEFKKMDTRTSREQLNMLARDAGKLGISAKDDILRFVVAANQVNVALGEDLGEDAMKNLGKLTDVYAKSTKELDKLDLKEKILSVGSAINELGANSTASEQYMLDFTKRMGGVAAQANISIQDILGYGSALDQSGQAVEMSATAFQNFIMKLMGEPAKFAKLAGLEVSKFTNLLQTDANEAIKQVLTALSNKGGFQQLIPVFKDMGLDGARAVGVLSALATNIKKVDEAQVISNKAFADNVSITNEYNTKNNNLQATLEKARKEFKDASLELGEKLNPALMTSTNYMTYLVKLLPSIIDFFSKYGKYILYLGVSYGSYIAVIKLATYYETVYNVILKLSRMNRITDASIREEIEKQITEIDQKSLEREIKRQAELKKILLTADPAAAEKEAYENRLRELGLFGIEREKLTKDQLSALELLEKQYNEKISKIERPDVLKKLKKLNEDQAKAEQERSEMRAKGLISEQQYQQELVLLDIAYTAKKLQIDGLTEEQRATLQKESYERQRKLYEDNAEIFARLNKGKKPENLKEAQIQELALLDSLFDSELKKTEAYGSI